MKFSTSIIATILQEVRKLLKVEVKKRGKKSIAPFALLCLFSSCLFSLPCFAELNQDDLLSPVSNFNSPQQKGKSHSSYFNLANIVDNFLSNEAQASKNSTDKKTSLRKDFLSIAEKFNQGNTLAAYDEYDHLIDTIDNDTSLLALSKVFYETGFYSLALKASEKIVYKNQFYDNILDLEKSYTLKKPLTKEEEIYFGKLYASIYFDNSSQEAILELLKKKNEYNKSDFYNFTLSRAYLELKKYPEALSAINKAISLNPNCAQFKVFKIDVLIGAKKYSDALNLIDKLEKNKPTVNFKEALAIKKELILSQTIKNDKEKKYHTVKKTYLEGNFEKSKKDCQNILNFDKDNDKILTIYAKNELALGNIERANAYFVKAYKLNKNNLETLIGLGDINYLHGDYKNSTKTYKKAHKQDKTNYEILLKLEQSEKKFAKNPKELKKISKKMEQMPKEAYLSYYKSALSFAQKDDVLKEELLKKALFINPMHENSLGALVELYIKDNNLQLAKNLIYSASITLEKNYYYYYLCGLYSQAVGKKSEAIQFFKTSLNLNSNFEIANVKILKLIPDITNEEI